MREFETRQRQCISLNSPTAKKVKFLVKQRLTWGYTLEKLALPLCTRLTADFLLTRDPKVFGEDKEFIQLPRLRDLHLMEMPTKSTLNDGAAHTIALVRQMPLLHLLAFDSPHDCNLGEWLPKTSFIAPLAAHIWKEKPHLRITIGGRNLQQPLHGFEKESIAEGGDRRKLFKANTELSLDKTQTCKGIHKGYRPKLQAHKTVIGLTASSPHALHHGSSSGDLKTRLSTLRQHEGKQRPASADPSRRRPSSISASRSAQRYYNQALYEDQF